MCFCACVSSCGERLEGRAKPLQIPLPNSRSAASLAEVAFFAQARYSGYRALSPECTTKSSEIPLASKRQRKCLSFGVVAVPPQVSLEASKRGSALTKTCKAKEASLRSQPGSISGQHPSDVSDIDNGFFAGRESLLHYSARVGNG
jgi:hypothetical protein